MSLIEEALRRIQDPLLAKHESGAQAPPKPAPRAEPAPAAHSWPTTPLPSLPPIPAAMNPLLAVSFSVLALTAVIVLGGTFWIGHHMVMRPTPIFISEPAERSQPRERPAAALAQPVTLAPAVTPAAGDGFTLSGIVEGMGEPYAVINGLIVGAGERVGDATVLDVANGVVKLRRENGREIVLSVPR